MYVSIFFSKKSLSSSQTEPKVKVREWQFFLIREQKPLPTLLNNDSIKPMETELFWLETSLNLNIRSFNSFLCSQRSWYSSRPLFVIRNGLVERSSSSVPIAPSSSDIAWLTKPFEKPNRSAALEIELVSTTFRKISECFRTVSFILYFRTLSFVILNLNEAVSRDS